MIELATQFDLSLRLLLAAALGALIGVEREIHGHPAGMRTHLLVSLGSATFTVLSIHGFGPPGTPGVDPSRIAAQIVSGIGFLGAGAILKEGATIRGLTTAASLWATAGVGLAAGAAAYPVAWTGAAIVIFSLWPLNRVAERLHAVDRATARIQVTVDRLDAIGEISLALSKGPLEIIGVQTERVENRRYAVAFDVRRRRGANIAAVIEKIARIDGVEMAGTESPE